MKLSQVAVILAAICAVSAGFIKKRDDDNPQIDVTFHKYDGEDCSGSGDEKDIDDGDCENFDYEFRSFWYEENNHFFLFWRHNDFDSDQCAVVVYENNDCLGRGYSLGSFPDTHDTCGLTTFPARSAAVVCDGSAVVGETSGYITAKPVGEPSEDLDVQ